MTLRRQLGSWTRHGHDLYSLQLTDQDGDEVTVWTMVEHGQPWLAYPFTTLNDGDLSPYQWLASGEDRLVWLDPGVAMQRELGDHDEPTASAQALVDRVASKLATGPIAAQVAPLDQLPPAEFWSRLETARPVPGRELVWPGLSEDDFFYCERVRDCAAESQESQFERLEQRAQRLIEIRGSGFGHTVRRGSDDALLSPSWLTVESAAMDPSSGRLVLAAYPSHAGLGLSPAYDLGAIDGRNAFTFPEAGHDQGMAWPCTYLYTGSFRGGALTPLSFDTNVQAVDLDPRSGNIALLEFLGSSTGAVAVVSTDGVRRLLTVVEDLSGIENLSFSSDGKWILVDRSHGSSTLVEVDSGRSVALSVANCCWWPLDASTLLWIDSSSGLHTPRLLNMAEHAVVRDFPAIEIPGLDRVQFGGVWGPRVDADGRRMLIRAITEYDEAHQGQHGAGSRVCEVELETGVGRAVHGAFLDVHGELERDVREQAWACRQVSGRGLQLAPDLAAQLREPITEHEYLSPMRWSAEAKTVLVTALNACLVEVEGNGVVQRLPELLAAMVTTSRSHEDWLSVTDWLGRVVGGTQSRIQAGRITGDVAAGWTMFARAKSTLDQGQPAFVDVVGAALGGLAGTDPGLVT